MSGKRMEESDICQVDLYVKSRVVSDTVELAKKSVAKLSSTERFNSLLRISPSSGDNGEGEEVYNTV